MSSLINITDIQRLLIHLCRTESIDAGEVEKLVKALIGWEKFVLLANAHGVAALAWDNLEKTGFVRYLPVQHASFLRNAMLMSMARNAALSAVFNDVNYILGKENIKVVALKGMALEHMIYGSRGLRQMSDLDILIRDDLAIRARQVLMKAGFKSLPVKSVLHRLILISIGKHLPSLYRSDHYVEIHHELFGRKYKGLTRLFLETAEERIVEGKTIYLPHPGIFFLYLVRHLERHEQNNESQLRLYTDLVVLLNKYPAEILNERLVDFSEKIGMNEALSSRLMILKEFWGIQFPSWLDHFIEKWHEPAFREKFIFFLGSPKGNKHLGTRRTYSEIFNEMPGLHRKALYFIGDLFPTVSFMKKRYKCKSVFTALFYYPHRLGKIMWLFRK